MRSPRLVLPLVCGLALAAALAALERPSPLFLNLGAGDAPFARGFRGGWERDGKSQSGETMFHWTDDGSRLEFPVEVSGGRLEARLRLARFAEAPAVITLLVGDRIVDEWTQASRGWSLRSVALGDVHGSLTLRFRSSAPDGLGVALDWAEVRDAERVWPRAELRPGLLALVLGVPVALGLWLRRVDAGLLALAGVLALTALALVLDRLGGLVACASAGGPALAGVVLLGAFWRGLDLAWPGTLGSPSALAIPAGALVVATVALSHPFYYYPDVDTHARFLAGIRADPYLGVDPSEYQIRVGAWTREIEGRRVAFPYSPVFHVMAWPLALVFGEVAAIKLAGALSLGATLLLVQALAAALELGAFPARLAALLLALLPVTSSRLVLALYPTLLGQALDLLVMVHLARRFAHLEGARDAGAAFLFLTLAQAAYTGSLLNMAVLVPLLALSSALAGESRRALRLLTAYALSATLVAVALYGHFLRVLWRDVLPHAAAAARQPGVATPALLRLAVFYGALYPLLVALGLVAVRRAPPAARRLLLSALAAGLALVTLRFVLAGLFRDAKEVELLAAPVAVLSAAGLAWLAARGRPERWLSLALGGAVLGWGGARAVAAYADRLLAVGRVP